MFIKKYVVKNYLLFIVLYELFKFFLPHVLGTSIKSMQPNMTL